MNHAFIKEVVSMPVMDRNGKQIQFEVFGNDWGGIILDDSISDQKNLIEDLMALREARTGGIVPCTLDEHSRKKSEWPFQPSALQYAQPIRTFHQPVMQSNPAVVAAVNPTVPTPEPVTVTPTVPIADLPKGEIKHFKPRLARVKKAAAA